MSGKAKGGGGKKIGRDTHEPSHARYNAEKRREKNKMRRAKRRANKFGHPVLINQHGKLVKVEPDK